MAKYHFALVELTESAAASQEQQHPLWKFLGARRLLSSFLRDEATVATSSEAVESPQLWPALRFVNSESCLEGLQALGLVPADGDSADLLGELAGDRESPVVYLFGRELPQGQNQIKVDNNRNNYNEESSKRFLRDLLENVLRHSSVNRLPLQEATAECLKAFLGEEFSKDRLIFWKINVQLPGRPSIEEIPWPCLLYHDAKALIANLHLTEKGQLKLAMDIIEATSKQPPQFREGFPLVYVFGSKAVEHAAIQPLDVAKIIFREEAGYRPTWLSFENRTYQQWFHTAHQGITQSHGGHENNKNIPQIAGPVDNNPTAAVHQMDEDFHGFSADAAPEDDVAINGKKGPRFPAAAPGQALHKTQDTVAAQTAVDDVARARAPTDVEGAPALQAVAPATEPQGRALHNTQDTVVAQTAVDNVTGTRAPSDVEGTQGIAMAGAVDVETTQWEPRATRKRTAAAAAAAPAPVAYLPRVDLGQIECRRCTFLEQPGCSPLTGPTHHATCLKSQDYLPPSEDILKTLSKEDFDNLPEATKKRFERDGLNQLLPFLEKRIPASLYRTIPEVPTPEETPSRRIVGLTLPTVCWVTPETREQRDRRKRWEREEQEKERRKRRR